MSNDHTRSEQTLLGTLRWSSDGSDEWAVDDRTGNGRNGEGTNGSAGGSSDAHNGTIGNGEGGNGSAGGSSDAHNGTIGNGGGGNGGGGNDGGGNGGGGNGGSGNGEGGNGGGDGGKGSAGGDSGPHSGKIANGAGSGGASAAEPTVVDRSHVPLAVLDSMRKQVGDFADFAHRSRVSPNSAAALKALGYGGGITAAVVDKMAAKLFGTAEVAHLGADQQTLTDSLLLSLVAPGDPDQLTERQRDLFVSWRGRLALDVSMAQIGDEPEVRPVSLHDARAVVIFGSAAFIADDRPYLSLDRLMSYARSKVYRSGGPDGRPPAQGAGLQAARNLEIVVLLDTSLEGGLWIDIDRTTGRVAAALAIGLSPGGGARFTHIPKLRAPKLRTNPEDAATA